MRLRYNIAAAGAVALIALAGTLPAVAQTATAGPHTASIGTEPSNYADYNVEHFGFGSSGMTWKSPVLDASEAANRDPRNFAPSGRKTTAAPNDSGVCSLYVGHTTLSGGALHAGTYQTCTGTFVYQYTDGHFARSSWDGDRWYGAQGRGPFVYYPTQKNDTAWAIGCGNGGTYNYRLYAVPHVWANSHDIGGPEEQGHSGRHTCGINP